MLREREREREREERGGDNCLAGVYAPEEWICSIWEAALVLLIYSR